MKVALWFLLFGSMFFIGGILGHAPWPALFGLAGLIIGGALFSQAVTARKERAQAQLILERLRGM